MMRSWLKLMPWCVVVWLAERYGERFTVNRMTCVEPFRGGPLIVPIKDNFIR